MCENVHAEEPCKGDKLHVEVQRSEIHFDGTEEMILPFARHEIVSACKESILRSGLPRKCSCVDFAFKFFPVPFFHPHFQMKAIGVFVFLNNFCN